MRIRLIKIQVLLFGYITAKQFMWLLQKNQKKQLKLKNTSGNFL
jgi:hypothetical protein